MRLVHSFSITLFVSALSSLSACSGDPADPAGTGGTGMSGAGGSGTSGTAGSGGSAAGTAGTGGDGTSGAGGAGTAGTAGSGTSGASGSGALDHPTDSSQAGIEAFLMAESYKTAGMGWRPEAIPSEGMDPPHLMTRRYFNETLIASKAAGNQPPTSGQHTTGSMAVKEILEGMSVVGKAALLRTDSQWIFYCVSSVDGRCSSSSVANTPYYAATAGQACACHGLGNITSHDAIPAP